MTRRNDWETPRKLFEYLDKGWRFNFDLDVAASSKNALCKNFLTQEADALTGDWKCRSAFCNPPYDQAREFTQMIIQKHNHDDLESFAILLPVRSDRIWFQRAMQKCRVSWITGRLHFGNSGKGAFMYNVIFYLGKYEMPPYVDAAQFNDNGKGGARS